MNRDYRHSGMTIQQAMVDSARSLKKGGAASPKVQWGNFMIQTSDCIPVARSGRFRIEFLSAVKGLRQGVDIRVNGAIRLADGHETATLRTWDDPDYESTVEYAFECHDGKLWVWNVYEVVHSSGETEDLKWTDNAGFWVEEERSGQRTYHCSAGQCTPPDFSAFIFKISIL